ncbi:suppressor of fused domain protein [Bacteroides stercorirosoris]|uniref:Tetratricopeptide repeat-containing protein n=1 Tax=Bacteroides stercorirosoris TaxID=871324 RepID=A0A1M6CWR6_9BACE|nr:suppressor of fused domain protein [Bacteroides stercorirosoris]SHI65515.1 Tetratricopeptide repeat-containing protein [Bacteroides stercorirosoris]
MSIGFRLTTKCKNVSSFQKLLDVVAARHEVSVSHTEDYSELSVCRLGNIFFNYEPTEDETVIIGDCQTNLLGAGFHKAAIDIVDEVMELRDFPFEVEDDTEYYEHRDFERMRSEHFYHWLNAIVELCQERMSKDGSMYAICWDCHKYMPREVEGTVVSPFGRIRPEHFVERIKTEGIEALANEFLMWNNKERDALFYRNTALSALWEDCYFMPSARSDEDEEINSFIIKNLETAAGMDASLPFPKEDYLQLCRLAEKEPIDVSALPDYVCEFSIGYRKGWVTYTLGNLKFSLPGNYLYFEEDDFRGYYDGENEDWHIVRLLACSVPDDEVSYMEEDAPVLVKEKNFKNGKCRLYNLGRGKDSDEYVFQCQAITEHQFSLFTISCKGKNEATVFSAEFIEHLEATKMSNHDELFKKIEQWNEEDEEQKIIDAILEIPEGERETELTGLLARAYNNLGSFQEALNCLSTIEEECKEDALWFYRVGYAHYYLNQLDKAQEAFERSLELDPDDEDAKEYIENCKNGVSPYRMELYEEEEKDALNAHLEKFFGHSDHVFHEIVSPDIHVDIYIIEPTAERNYYTLVTLGMGAHWMNVPYELAEYKLERAELLIYLPADWDIQGDDEKYYWPLRWLKILARLPLEQDTWLGWGHTVPNGGPFAENTLLSGVLLINPEDVEDGAAVCQLPNGEEVNFYQVIPLYEEEMNFKIAKGAEALLGKMGGVNAVVDINRANVCAGFKLPKRRR